MRTTSNLRRLFTEVLAASAALGAAAGCGGVAVTSAGNSSEAGAPGSGVDGGISLGDGAVSSDGATLGEGFTSVCSKGQLSVGIKDVQADAPLDYLSTRSENWILGYADAGNSAWEGSTAEQTGTPCATATNKTACQSALSALRVLPTDAEACKNHGSGGMIGNACFAWYWAYTRGDVVGTAQTPQEQIALIGHVDSLPEALLLAGYAGYSLSCEGLVPAQAKKTAEGYELVGLRAPNCGKEQFRAHIKVTFAGVVTETSAEKLPDAPSCSVAGRRPEGLSIPQGSGGAIGAWLAEMGALEAASIVAFRRIHQELQAHGAPRSLLRRVRRAARDEVRHARTMRTLAKEHGGPTLRPQIPAAEERSLTAFAVENAREGCVRETYGALMACWQATYATDPKVREAMSSIAQEETEHAALSWDIARWVESKLDASGLELVRAAREDARRALAEAVAAPVDADLVALAGVPTPAQATLLLGGLTERLLAA